MTITFTVEIDWTHDSSWTDETSRTRRVRIKSGFDEPGHAVAAIGRCVLTMDNGDQRFSPGYASSPLYGNLLPRRQVRISASDGVTTWVLFRGFVDEIKPDAGEWGRDECVITCVDGIALLGQQRIGVAHEDSKAVDVAVSAVVVSAYTPPDSDYADNGDTLTHYGRAWQPERTTCLDALREIAEAVYGRFYVARDGTTTYLSRDDRQDSSVSAEAVLGSAEYWERVAAVQPDHLVAYWRLNESSGTDAADSSGNGYDGEASGVTWGEEGIGDGATCARFDGVNDFIKTSNATFRGLTSYRDEGTLMCWLKVNSYASDVYPVRLTTASGPPYTFGVEFRIPTNGNWLARRSGATDSYPKQVSFNPGDPTGWQHWVMTWRVADDSLKMYLNGESVGTPVSGIVAASTADLYENQCQLGAQVNSPSPSGVLDGWLAHVALWDVALTPDEIAQMAEV